MIISPDDLWPESAVNHWALGDRVDPRTLIGAEMVFFKWRGTVYHRDDTDLITPDATGNDPDKPAISVRGKQIEYAQHDAVRTCIATADGVRFKPQP
jgi:hypothetical protein